MSKSSGPPPIVFILLFLLLAAGGYWFFVMKPAQEQVAGTSNTPNLPGNNPPPPPSGNNPPPLPSAPVPGVPPASTSFSLQPSVPAGTTVKIDGSTSMVVMNKNLKNGFEQKYPGTSVVANSGGTDKGIQDVVSGNVDIAAISRPLRPQEQSQGLVAVPVAVDAIAVVVGKNNPFTAGLTADQLKGIFQGQVTDWSAVNGPAGEIKVINRPTVSGTYQAFQELVLGGGNFGTGANITSLSQDATTPLLQALGNNGIGYATYAQVAQQQTVRVVPINNLTPNNPSYPYKRTLFYVYKNPPNPAVQGFLGYATSPAGQQVMFSAN